MRLYTIPVTESPNQAISIVLDGALYEIRLVWNILGFWSLSIADSGGAVLLSGVKVVLQIDFFKDHPDIGLPPGSLYAVDMSNAERDVGRYDFVNERKVQLIYWSVNE